MPTVGPMHLQPLVLNVGMAVDRKPMTFTTRGRTVDYAALNLVSAGHGVFAQDPDRRESSVQAGDLLSLHPHHWHRFGPSHRQTWTEFWVVYDRKAVVNRLGAELAPPPGCWTGGGTVDPELARAFEDLHGLALTRPPG
jgi:hypothetical protein